MMDQAARLIQYSTYGNLTQGYLYVPRNTIAHAIRLRQDLTIFIFSLSDKIKFENFKNFKISCVNMVSNTLL